MKLVVGRIGKEPEFKSLHDGVNYCTFPVAEDIGYGNKKTTQWHRITVWRKPSEVLKSAHKGDWIVVQGLQKLGIYNNMPTSDIAADFFKICWAKKEEQPEAQGPGIDDSAPF